MMIPTDETLYSRVLEGDTAAFEGLVDRYHGPLFRFLYRMLGEKAAAEDLLQETFTRLIIYQGPPPERFQGWAYTVASNLARDYFRSARYRHETAPPDDETGLMDEAPSPDELIASQMEADVVAKALHQLTPDHRAVVILRFFNDLTLEQIATISEVSVGTVKSRLFHALKRLRGLLAERVGGSPR